MPTKGLLTFQVCSSAAESKYNILRYWHNNQNFRNLGQRCLNVSEIIASIQKANPEVLPAVHRYFDEGLDLVNAAVGVVQVDPEALVFTALVDRDTSRVLMSNFSRTCEDILFAMSNIFLVIRSCLKGHTNISQSGFLLSFFLTIFEDSL